MKIYFKDIVRDIREGERERWKTFCEGCQRGRDGRHTVMSEREGGRDGAYCEGCQRGREGEMAHIVRDVREGGRERWHIL